MQSSQTIVRMPFNDTRLLFEKRAAEFAPGIARFIVRRDRLAGDPERMTVTRDALAEQLSATSPATSRG